MCKVITEPALIIKNMTIGAIAETTIPIQVKKDTKVINLTP